MIKDIVKKLNKERDISKKDPYEVYKARMGVMIKGIIKKISNMKDISKEEADNIYTAINNYELNSSDLKKFLDAAVDAVHKGLRGNFITAIPITLKETGYGDREMKTSYIDYEIKIRSCLQPKDRISCVYFFNVRKVLRTDAGVRIMEYVPDAEDSKKHHDVKCNRFGLMKRKIPEIFDTNVKMLKIGENKMEDYLSDYFDNFSYGLSFSNGPKNTFFMDMKMELLRKSDVPIMLVRDDYLYDDPPAKRPAEDLERYIIFAKDCDISRRVADMKPGDVISAIRSFDKSDVLNIINRYCPKDRLAEIER